MFCVPWVISTRASNFIKQPPPLSFACVFFCLSLVFFFTLGIVITCRNNCGAVFKIQKFNFTHFAGSMNKWMISRCTSMKIRERETRCLSAWETIFVWVGRNQFKIGAQKSFTSGKNVSVKLPDGDKDHSENQIFPQQRHNQRRWWNNFDNQQEEHVETNKNRYRKRYLSMRNKMKKREKETRKGEEEAEEARNQKKEEKKTILWNQCA